MTNFERITKSPKELAEFMMSEDIILPECSWCKDRDCSECDWSCYRCLLKWLDEEVGTSQKDTEEEE